VCVRDCVCACVVIVGVRECVHTYVHNHTHTHTHRGGVEDDFHGASHVIVEIKCQKRPNTYVKRTYVKRDLLQVPWGGEELFSWCVACHRRIQSTKPAPKMCDRLYFFFETKMKCPKRPNTSVKRNLIQQKRPTTRVKREPNTAKEVCRN